MKYVFVAGAPGSKWSSVVKNIYYSPDVDRSDYSEARTYWHDATGQLELMHLGAYFDPGMEFGGFFHRLQEHGWFECETEFDRPFTGTGVRIIKSHVFADNIDYIKRTWPDCPVVMVHRPDDACLGWWVKCGHFDITYPDYHQYYRDLKTMSQIIAQQNRGIVASAMIYPNQVPANNRELCTMLGIAHPPAEYFQDYAQSDIKVTVI